MAKNRVKMRVENSPNRPAETVKKGLPYATQGVKLHQKAQKATFTHKK